MFLLIINFILCVLSAGFLVVNWINFLKKTFEEKEEKFLNFFLTFACSYWFIAVLFFSRSINDLILKV